MIDDRHPLYLLALAQLSLPARVAPAPTDGAGEHSRCCETADGQGGKAAERPTPRLAAV